MLRYAEHKLYVRKMTWGIIGILSSVGVNLPALRMVANLVIRRIDPEIAAISPSSSLRGEDAPVARAAAREPADAGRSRWRPRSCPRSRAHDPLPVIPEDGRDEAATPSERHVHMYRGRPVGD